ncbi:MAG: hypothetical protein RIR97_296 [Pseudomonadota bacterium]
MTDANGRHADYPVDPQFLNRWSPRAFTGEDIPEGDILTMLEAARFAPSSSNGQPWRFVYTLRGTPEFDKILSSLVPFNQGWAKSASALMLVISKAKRLADDGEMKPVASHSFDAGSAWMSFALQAAKMGYFAHGMGGVDFDAARAAFSVPENYTIEIAVAIGKRAPIDTLPEALAAREVPNHRIALNEIAFNGVFIGD